MESIEHSVNEDLGMLVVLWIHGALLSFRGRLESAACHGR